MSLSARFITRMALSPAVSRSISCAQHRRFASDAPAAAISNDPNELRLTLASPSKVFYKNKPVRQIDALTLAGAVGILATHVPTIAMLKPGVMSVYELDGEHKRLFVSSGSLSMNIDGSCQIVAEEAIAVEDIDISLARKVLDEVNQMSSTDEISRVEKEIQMEVAEALVKAAEGN